MNPFDTPPTGEPVTSPISATPRPPAPDEPPRRGRMALVAVLTAGLVGGGIAGVSALASADRPETAVPAVSPDGDDTDEPTSDEPTSDEPASSDATDASDEESDEPAVEGELEFDLGDGDPIVIDLGDLDEGAIDRLNECIGFPSFDVTWGDEFDPGDLPFGDFESRLDELFGENGEFGAHLDELFGEFGHVVGDGSVTVTGPDGVSVVDLGENGSVTVTKEDGEVTISTSGDATVSEVSELFGDADRIIPGPGPHDGEFGDLEGDLEEWLDMLIEDLPDLDALPDLGNIEPIDPAAVQTCIDEVLGN